MRTALRQTRDAYRRAQFLAWSRKLDLQLRRSGSRLRLSAPHGAVWEAPPRIRVIGVAERPTALTLTIGAGVSFERDVVIEVRAAADNELTIGDVTILHDRTTLQLHGGSIVFGDHVQVRRDALLKSSGRLTIGARTQVSHGAIVHCAARVDIEPCVALAERVTVVDSDHVFDGTDEHWMTRPLKLMPVHIGRNAFVGTNAVVMRGARIGANAVIAPSSVVPRGDYEASWLHAGSPARPVKELRPAPAPS